MYPPKFDYHRASSAAEALTLQKEHDGKFIAGGHSLIPVLKLRLADPGNLIDIGRIEDMKGIGDAGDSVVIGALTTHAMINASDDVPTALSEAAGMIGDPQVRNRGTVGGNLAHADPASDLPTVMLGLKATITTVGESGSRTVAADDFFTGLFETALEEGEILVEVTVPKDGANTGSAYVKLFNPASRYAMVGCCARVTVEGGNITAASVAVGGLTSKATRASAVEAALVGKPANEDSVAQAVAAVDGDLGDDVSGDIHGSADYRRQMAPVFVARAVNKAISRA